MPNTSRCHASRLDGAAEAKNSSEKPEKERIRLTRRPLGGSLVSFTPFCSTGTGKVVDGIDDSHSRKSGCTGSVSLTSSSTIFSRDGIHDVARWQFWSATHSPSAIPRRISFSARGPCPWPSEIICMRSPMPIASRKRRMIEVGSAPVDNTKMIGVRAVVSRNTSSIANGTASTYLP